MYIFELLYKLLNKKSNDVVSSEKTLFIEEEEYNNEKCEHIFIPIDSTKKVLACSKCGLLHKIKDKPVKNFFMKQ